MADGLMIEVPATEYSAIEYALGCAADALEKQDAWNAAMNLADVRPRPLTTLVRDAQRTARSYFPSAMAHDHRGTFGHAGEPGE